MEAETVWRFSTDLHCADCDIHYREPTPSLFSFNSPLGACETCRGFGRVIGIDYGLVVPDPSRTLRGGAVKPWQTSQIQGVSGFGPLWLSLAADGDAKPRTVRRPRRLWYQRIGRW